MGGEVCRVELRAGRFVEAGPRAGRFVEACISWVHGQVLVWCAWNNTFRCVMRLRVLHDLWLVLWMCVVYEVLGDTLKDGLCCGIP